MIKPQRLEVALPGATPSNEKIEKNQIKFASLFILSKSKSKSYLRQLELLGSRAIYFYPNTKINCVEQHIIFSRLQGEDLQEAEFRSLIVESFEMSSNWWV